MNIIRDMIFFVEVGKRENFTQAARSLGIPLSTLARRISVLEEKLGMILIERTTRQQRLTVDGRRYFERCKHVVDDALAAYDEVHFQSHGIAGSVRIGVDQEIAGLFLAEAVTRFIAEHEAVDVRVDVGHVNDLTDDNFDLVVRVGEPKSASSVVRKIGVLSLGLYAAPSYLEKHQKIESHNALKDHPLIIPSDVIEYCGKTIGNLSPKNINFEGKLMCDTFSMVASLSSIGKGISVLPTEVAQLYVKAGLLSAVLETWVPATLPIFIVMTSKRLPARLRVFITFLSSLFLSKFNTRREPEISDILLEMDKAKFY